MKKQKKIWIPLLLLFILIIVLSGCSGVIGPKTAEINITVEPDPVSYNSEIEKWRCDMTISESNGVGVTLTSIRFDRYDDQDQLYGTQILYEEDIIDWFDSDYIPAFSSLQSGIVWTSYRKYIVVTIEGIDDNNSLIEATGRVDFLPQ